jgi:uncharacterized protein YbjQ (UPF0145 family)
VVKFRKTRSGRGLAVIKGVLIGAIVLFMFGCASKFEALSGEQRARLSGMEVYKNSELNIGYELIGKVTGVSCHRNKYFEDSVSVDDAVGKMKIEAAALNADAVINAVCQSKGVDWVHNCWSSVVCVGDAVRFK